MSILFAVYTPQVVEGLVDVDCDESTIKTLWASVIGDFSIDELVHEVERHKLYFFDAIT